MGAQAWSELSEDKQKQVGDFLQFLLAQQREAQQQNASGFPFGILKGEIEVSDHFDDPLPEM